MSDMMERLCRAAGDAIAFQVGNNECFAPDDVGVCDDTQCWCKNTASYVVDQILRELREPSDDALEAGCVTLPDYDPGMDDTKLCWQAMIDAILEDG